MELGFHGMALIEHQICRHTARWVLHANRFGCASLPVLLVACVRQGKVRNPSQKASYMKWSPSLQHPHPRYVVLVDPM
jgi:hypothetical protein